jgi:hypothetical protein
VMNSLPPQDRGAGGGMNQTFQNSAQVLSVGIFFTLMIVGLSADLPHALASGLHAHGVSAATAHGAAQIPPVSILFSAFLGYNPIEHLIGAHALGALSPANHALVTGRSFFPHLISSPFSSGLHEAFVFAIVACLVAAAASLLRGGMYHHGDPLPARGSSNGASANGLPDVAPTRVLNGASDSPKDQTRDNGDASELARGTNTREEQHAS